MGLCIKHASLHLSFCVAPPHKFLGISRERMHFGKNQIAMHRHRFCSSTLTAVIELWQLLAAVVLVKCGRLSQPKLAFSARYNIVILTYLLTYLLELDYLT